MDVPGMFRLHSVYNPCMIRVVANEMLLGIRMYLKSQPLKKRKNREHTADPSLTKFRNNYRLRYKTSALIFYSGPNS